MRARGLGVAVLAALLVAAPAGATGWRDVLERAGEASRSTSYEGEALWITFTHERPYVSTVHVAADGHGSVVVDTPERSPLRVGADRAGRQEGAAGWVLPVPPAFDNPGPLLDALADNYDVALDGTERVMDRPCSLVTLRSKADGRLRERLWVDEDTALVLRRETYDDGGELVRLASYLTLDLDPPAPLGEGGVAAGETLAPAMPVDEPKLDALRESGWTVPRTLPGGYAVVGAYAMATEDGQPLHLVYADGLYTVSLFQQAGSPDWDSLPPGARRVDGLPGNVYDWPGALPHRLVWAADGKTWSLVGDAPPDALRSLAEALPQAERPGLLQRLGRGFSRLWSWVTQWG